jgi:hypothetical protein
MAVMVFTNRTAEPPHLAVDTDGVRTAPHPSNEDKSTVSPRAPPLVIAANLAASAGLASRRFTKQ